MAGAGVPVSMDDGAGIAAAPEIVCPLPGVAEKWPEMAPKRKGPPTRCGAVRRERVFFLGVGFPYR